MTSVTHLCEFPCQADFSSPLSRLCEHEDAGDLRGEVQLLLQTVETSSVNEWIVQRSLGSVDGGLFAHSNDLSCTHFGEANGRDELMAFESLLAYSRIFAESPARRREETPELPFAVALDDWQGDVYSEETFRHFLG